MHHAQGQSVTFCKSVDRDGHAMNAGREFILSAKGAAIVFLFQSPTNSPVSISYDLYKLEKGKEIFSSTMKQVPEPGKSWTSKEIVLYDAGTYRVYVYDDQDKLLTKSDLVVKRAAN